MLNDIAIVTGGKAIMNDLGLKLEEVTLEDLGRAKKVVVDADNCTIIDGAGDKDAIKARIKEIEREISETNSDWDKDKLRERHGEDRRRRGHHQGGRGDRRRDPREEGAGGGRPARHPRGRAGGHRPRRRRGPAARQKALDELKLRRRPPVRRRARSAGRCEEPLRQIARNAGFDGSVVVERVRNQRGQPSASTPPPRTANTRTWWPPGVIDPAKVVRVALQNAASVAGLMLTTECLIDRPAQQPTPPPTPEAPPPQEDEYDHHDDEHDG